ncbi:hypothetical protein B0T16DRAFT_35937 [Cercophora newfieldiana]|uniref:Uncharacterized protein n=1 Tax=Cercophora newfieldiana TaxID=92897 RepID=A0AA40CYL0_9PEZI|nr:hypothetical protein B0T16DRAFT_35937 [Cercophora newfieldiana]
MRRRPRLRINSAVVPARLASSDALFGGGLLAWSDDRYALVQLLPSHRQCKVRRRGDPAVWFRVPTHRAETSEAASGAPASASMPHSVTAPGSAIARLQGTPRWNAPCVLASGCGNGKSVSLLPSRFARSGAEGAGALQHCCEICAEPWAAKHFGAFGAGETPASRWDAIEREPCLALVVKQTFLGHAPDPKPKGEGMRGPCRHNPARDLWLALSPQRTLKSSHFSTRCRRETQDYSGPLFGVVVSQFASHSSRQPPRCQSSHGWRRMQSTLGASAAEMVALTLNHGCLERNTNKSNAGRGGFLFLVSGISHTLAHHIYHSSILELWCF